MSRCLRFDAEGDCADCGKPKHKGGACRAFEERLKETA